MPARVIVGWGRGNSKHSPLSKRIWSKKEEKDCTAKGKGVRSQVRSQGQACSPLPPADTGNGCTYLHSVPQSVPERCHGGPWLVSGVGKEVLHSQLEARRETVRAYSSYVTPNPMPLPQTLTFLKLLWPQLPLTGRFEAWREEG